MSEREEEMVLQPRSLLWVNFYAFLDLVSLSTITVHVLLLF